MKNIALQGLTLGVALWLSGCAAKDIPPPPPPEIAEVETQDSPQHLERATAIKVTAVVTDIDVGKRLVTLKGSDGNEETIEVGPDVRNLAQVHRGDEVVVTYYESMVFQLYKPGQAKPGSSAAQVGERAKPGEKPGAVGAEAVTITATVEKVDKQKPSITLWGPDGKSVIRARCQQVTGQGRRFARDHLQARPGDRSRGAD
jgi:hypothetical protein